MRKLLVIFAVLAGLFAFQDAIPESLPREKARIELVVKYQNEIAPAFIATSNKVYFVVRQSLQKAQVLRPHLLALLISSQQHHASL